MLTGSVSDVPSRSAHSADEETAEPDLLAGSVLEAPPLPARSADEDVEPRPDLARPAGKPRATGTVQPTDLADAEAEAAGPVSRRTNEMTRRSRNGTLNTAIGLAVVALVLAGLALWFRSEAQRLTEGADSGNQALIDTARASEAVGQLRGAVEKALTYNYTDLDSTATAVRDNLAGRALCQHDKLFGEVRTLAPAQRLVLTTRVRDIGVARLDGDAAELLVFVDQTTTRVDQNQTTAGGAQFIIRGDRIDGRWKITGFDMLGQRLPNGQPAPQC